jgi:protein-S-isoprenylcysteine O-methyltransferase Ste14
MLKTASILGYVAMMGGLIGLIALRAVLSPSPLVIAVQVAASCLMIWARITFGRRSFHAAANPTQGGLVTSGPYRYIRHPIYTAMCLFAGASIAAHLSWETAACGILMAVGAAIRIYCEETLVVERYPDYAQYAARTKRMIPFVL